MIHQLGAQVAHPALEAFLAVSHEAQITWLQAGMLEIIVFSFSHHHPPSMSQWRSVAQPRKRRASVVCLCWA
jgi:hypothetical protein